MLTEDFMLRALLAALLLSPLCAFLGVFVTARRMAFFSETIAHGAVAGVALGLMLGFTDLSLPVLAVGLGTAWFLMWLRERTVLAPDTLMALLLTGSLSLGLILLSLQRGDYRAQVHAILFGDILAVGWPDVMLAGLLFLGGVGAVYFRLGDLTLLTANEELAHVSGVPVRRLNLLFVMGLTLVVALSVRLVGVLLLNALIVIPAASARNVSRSLRQHLLLSMILGWVAALAGVWLSYRFDLASGPAIGAACVLLFLVTLVMRNPVVRRQTGGRGA